jgi:PAS domain S-box-containing protein
VNGTLVLGRNLDAATITELGQTNHLEVTLFQENGRVPADVHRAMVELQNSRPYHVVAVSTEKIAGYLLIRDLDNRPVGVLRVLLARSLYTRGWQSVRVILLSLVLIGLVISALVIFLLEKQVLSPLAHLSADVTRIGKNGNLAARLPVKGEDELARLAAALNEMLTSMEASQEELRKKEALRESEERYRTLVELSPDAVYLVRDGQFIFTNAAGVDLLGAVEPQDLLGHARLSVVHPESSDNIQRRLERQDVDLRLPTEERFMRMDGTVVEETISHMAGAQSPQLLSLKAIRRLITEAGRVPAQRDTHYHELD